MKIEYLGHLVSGRGILIQKQKVQGITELASATNITEARHIIGVIGYTGNSFLYLVMWYDH